MILTPRERLTLVGRANSFFEKAIQAKYPEHMFAKEAVAALYMVTHSYSMSGDIMRDSRYGPYASQHGFPLVAMPAGKTEADPPKKKKPDFWKPLL
jgi:hypothetical protein